MDAKRVINGSYGAAWINGDKLANISGLQAKVTQTKSAVNFCGDLWERQKVVGLQGKGTLKMHKIDSRMAIMLKDSIKNGQQVTCTIVASLNDPDSYGAERVVLKDVIFDELTIMDFEVKKNIEESIAFTFSDYDYLDLIQPQDG